jgi:hypothetical protein
MVAIDPPTCPRVRSSNDTAAQSTTIHGGSRRSSLEARHASGRSSTALPADDGGEDRDVIGLVRGPLEVSGLIPEPMRAHARAQLAKRCVHPSSCWRPSGPMAVGLSPKDGSLPSFPWNHEGSGLSANREEPCPFALLPMTIRPHECRPQGQGITPIACLAGP